MIADLLSMLTEERLAEWLDRYRSWGPLPGLLVPFLKSFVPPLPTIVIVGWNAVVYGLWVGFLYTWIGMVAGCITTFLIVRKIAEHPIMLRWGRRPKVARAMHWIRQRAFSYVFLLSILPAGPFVVVNTAAALTRMNVRSFALAVSGGKAIMIFTISYFGHDPGVYFEQPWRLLFILALVAVSLVLSKRINARFADEAPRSDSVTETA
ncbi:TVP38/TMEM64 family protein [Paenibacillus sp.]|uniref:TVP38/TMEM64 family protein n=1 Tax=Paenibacillus sp. TaxID=58172 RepID=UPI002810E1E6|nr:TVP38/TMEM64 family protein [Paenibacillus sp.]